MNSTFRILIAILLYFTSFVAHSQQVSRLDAAYGLDPLLYNGKLYRYYVAPGTIGTPFIYGNEFSRGWVKIRGVTFDNVLLNYDIYNQQLVYKYANPDGGINHLIISDAWLEAFHFFGSDFELHALPDTVRRIYRVLGQGPMRIMYYSLKELKIDTPLGATNLRFSSPIQTSWLYKDSTLLKFTNNRSFVRLFNEDKRPELKKFMRANRINVKKSDDSELRKLLEFCNTIT
jgi:hypothetical protein